MRTAALVVATVFCQCNALAKEPTFRTGIISSTVSASTTNGLSVTLIPGEVVQTRGVKQGNNFSVKPASLDEYVEVPARVVLFEDSFARIGRWTGQKKFNVFSASYDSGCRLQFRPNGSFISDYDCNCSDSRKNTGSMYAHGNFVWAKGACNEGKSISQWSVFVTKKNGELCQVGQNYERNRSECFKSEDD
jgi:hypothetical protein